MGVIMHNNIPYGGGSTIEPNPQESATDQLETLGIDGDVYEVTDANAAREVQQTITEAQSRTNLANGDDVPTIFGKIKKFFSDLKTVAFTGAYSDLSGTPTIPTVNNGTLTIQKNGTNVQTFSANQSGNATANIECALPSDVEGSKVATGNPLTITDAAGIKAEKIEITFEPKQDKHGYGSVWVGGAGKNKLPITVAGIKAANSGVTWNGNVGTLNGMTFTINTDSDGNFTGLKCVSQSTTSTSFVLFEGSVNVSSGSKFNLSANRNNNTFDCTVTNNGTDIGYISGNSASTADVTLNDTTVTKVNLYFNSRYTDIITVYPMIRNSADDPTFEPYSNISPITGYTSLSADRCGKNLLNIGNAVSDWFATASDGVKIDLNTDITTRVTATVTPSTGTITVTYYNNNGYKWMSKVVNLAKNTQYIYSASQSAGFKILGFDNLADGSVGTVINSTRDVAFNTGNYNYYVLSFYPSNANISSMMIRQKDETNIFEPFKGDNVTVQFGQTLYGGKLTILQDGSADVDVDTGFDVYTGENTENWVFSYQNSYYQAARENTAMKNSLDAMTNEFENIALSDRGTKNGFVTYSDTTIRVALLPSFGITSVAQWQAFLASHNLQVSYKLATPFTIHLSPVETLNLLQGINNVWTDGTTLSLTYQPDNAIGQAKGTAQAAMMSTIWTSLGVFSHGATPTIPQCKELLLSAVSADGTEYYCGEVFPYALYGSKFLVARPIDANYVCELKPDGSVIAGGTYKLAIFYR